MNKQTKTILGLAIVGVGGYMLWKSMKPAPAQTTQFIGDRQRLMVGMSGKKNLTDINTDVVRDSGWLRASGKLANSSSTKMFEVEDSGWLRASGKLANSPSNNMFDIKDSGWLRMV